MPRRATRIALPYTPRGLPLPLAAPLAEALGCDPCASNAGCVKNWLRFKHLMLAATMLTKLGAERQRVCVCVSVLGVWYMCLSMVGACVHGFHTPKMPLRVAKLFVTLAVESAKYSLGAVKLFITGSLTISLLNTQSTLQLGSNSFGLNTPLAVAT